MNIWIDLANSPQVLFFRAIIPELRRRGHCVVITSRDFAQTVALADEYGIPHEPIGRHGGSRWAGIVWRNAARTMALVRWARTKGGIDLAVSHNSYSQAVAARLLGIRFITLMDYEFQPLNHLCFRLAQRVIVCEPFPTDKLEAFGARYKARKYGGLKEELYLADFRAQPGFLKNEGLDPEDIIIVVRPPAPWAVYQRSENTLFDDVMSYLTQIENATIVFLPRIGSQAEWARRLDARHLVVPAHALHGPDLVYAADVVISGGGTMNREAAVLGTPAFTIFKGNLAAADKFLIERGRMARISETGDIGRIPIQKKNPEHRRVDAKKELVKQVTGLILDPS